MIMSKTISVSQIKEAAQEAYEQFKDNTGGKNADYIPYLANIDKNLFGISICLLDGRTITLGDSSYCFGIETESKVHTSIHALLQNGDENRDKAGGHRPPDQAAEGDDHILRVVLQKEHDRHAADGHDHIGERAQHGDGGNPLCFDIHTSVPS